MNTCSVGLIGQYGIRCLTARGFYEILVRDNADANAAVLKEHRPDIDGLVVTFAVEDGWQDKLPGVDAPIHAQSQIGRLISDEFTRNTGVSNERVTPLRIRHIVLRPTLMFGWFGRSLEKISVFAIPGLGRDSLQPPFARDVCNDIVGAAKAHFTELDTGSAQVQDRNVTLRAR